MSETVNEREVINMFIFETEESLRSLEQTLIEVDNTRRFTEDQVNRLFREMHTLKGSSAMLHLSAISDAAALIEDLFENMRGSTDNIDPEQSKNNVNLLYEALNYFQLALSNLSEGQELPEIPQVFRSWMDEVKPKKNSMPEQTVAQPKAEYGIWVKDAVCLRVRLKKVQMPIVRAAVLIRSFRKYCDELVTIPPEPDKHPETAAQIMNDGLLLLFRLKECFMQSQLLEALGKNPYVLSFAYEELPQEVLNSINEKKSSRGKTSHRAEEDSRTVSVRQAKLDEMIDLVNELSINEALLAQELSMQAGYSEMIERRLSHSIKLVAQLQRSAVAINLMECDGLFFRLRLLARDMAQKQGKDLRMVCYGGNIEVEKNILDVLHDPLMHIIRNSIDHGIETPEERIKKGKNVQGKLILDASISNNRIRIVVEDDGDGVNTEAVEKKARALGLIEEGENCTEQELIQMIMRPGFSTSQNITEYSGRGVGLDVLSIRIKELGGEVQVRSVRGQGTTFTLLIPATLSVSDLLEVRSGDINLLIPVSNIKQIFLNSETKKEAADQLRNIISLRECLGQEKSDQDGGVLLILNDLTEEADMILCVDSVGQIRTVVVKPLPKKLIEMAEVSSTFTGCCISGNGYVKPILDCRKLRSSAQRGS